jgi:hypothetical protein
LSAVTVIYKGHAPAVEGGGFVFPNGEPVEVPAELAERLGSAFEVQTKEGRGN